MMFSWLDTLQELLGVLNEIMKVKLLIQIAIVIRFVVTLSD